MCVWGRGGLNRMASVCVYDCLSAYAHWHVDMCGCVNV